ncbi:hypothetical protein, partial [Plasmodium yoelii yoelii]
MGYRSGIDNTTVSIKAFYASNIFNNTIKICHLIKILHY